MVVSCLCSFLFTVLHTQVDTTSGRLAQLVEHLLDVQEVVEDGLHVVDVVGLALQHGGIAHRYAHA